MGSRERRKGPVVESTQGTASAYGVPALPTELNGTPDFTILQYSACRQQLALIQYVLHLHTCIPTYPLTDWITQLMSTGVMESVGVLLMYTT